VKKYTTQIGRTGIDVRNLYKCTKSEVATTTKLMDTATEDDLFYLSSLRTVPLDGMSIGLLRAVLGGKVAWR